MPRNHNVPYFPASDLDDIQLTEIQKRFSSLSKAEITARRRNNPLLRLGKGALEIFTKDPQFFNEHTGEEVGSLLLGYQTYQDFSDLANQDRTLGRSAIETSIADIAELHKRHGYAGALLSIQQSYKEGLPKTSHYLAHVAYRRTIPLGPFSQGASIAYKLEIGARSAAILDT